MPIATAAPSGTSFADALFTAISVICVTGLSTVDIATNWSAFGNGVVLVGVEIDGVGAPTLASILELVISRKLVIEAVIAPVLLPRVLLGGVALPDAIWQSIYFGAVAFTNTGFVPIATGLAPYANDVWFLGVLMLGVLLGSIGFPVIYVLSRTFRKPRRWSLYAKLTLLTSGVLLVLGAVTYFGLEFSNPTLWERWMADGGCCNRCSSRS